MKLWLSFNLAGSWLIAIPFLRMTSTDGISLKFVKHLRKALLLLYLQLLVHGSLADLVVKEKDIAHPVARAHQMLGKEKIAWSWI